jgi:hypothetical protein
MQRPLVRTIRLWPGLREGIARKKVRRNRRTLIAA